MFQKLNRLQMPFQVYHMQKKRIEKQMNFVISGEEAQHGGLLAHFL